MSVSLENLNMTNSQRLGEKLVVSRHVALIMEPSCLRADCHVQTVCFSLVRDEVDHIEPDIAVVPHIQVSVLRAVGEHCQHSAWRPQVKGHIDRLSLQQVKSKGDSGVLGVGDIQDPTGDEGVAGLVAGVGGVHVGRDGEGLLVQLAHHDALIDT